MAMLEELADQTLPASNEKTKRSVFLAVSLVFLAVFIQQSALMYLGFWLSLNTELPFGDDYGFAAIAGTVMVFAWFVVGPISIVAAVVFAVVGAFRSRGAGILGEVQALVSVAIGIYLTYLLFTT